MCREDQLLLYCSRTYLDAEKAGAVRRIVKENLDWDYILENGSFYGISSLLFYNLKRIANENATPPTAMERLKQLYSSVAHGNMRIYSELRKVLQILQNEGIPVIILKGAALAETIYPSIALRPMEDIDLLVKKVDLYNVAGILSKLGYVSSSKYPIEFYEKHHHLMPYAKRDKSVTIIEVHHNIAPEPFMSKISTDSLWEGLQTAHIAGVNALVLSPENLILHLCLHLSHDFFVGKMRILVDISEAIRYYGRNLDWHSIIRKSNECEVGSFVYYSVYLTKEIMDAPIPIYALDGLKRDPELKPFEAKLLRMILRKGILRSRDSFFPPWFIASLCKEFFYTSDTRDRMRNVLKITSRSAVRYAVNVPMADPKKHSATRHPL